MELSTTMSEKCNKCFPILGRMVKSHLPNACPLLRGSYCGLCAAYGHSPANCPDGVTRAYREPQFVEQLIPSSLIEQYGIISQSPLPGVPSPQKAKEFLMEIPETDEGLRAALTAAGVKPMICQEKGKKENREITENKKRLQKVADKAGRKLIFIKPK
jgi:hypothetical protein